MTAKFLNAAVRPLAAAQMPKIEGIDLIRGESFHSYYWPHENNGYGGKAVDFSGKRVGVIGTGATGVQIISEVAKTAAELVVFQRHPNWCAPLCNSTIDQDRMDEIKRKYDDILAYRSEEHTSELQSLMRISY